jgi:hypothetical protein
MRVALARVSCRARPCAAGGRVGTGTLRMARWTRRTATRLTLRVARPERSVALVWRRAWLARDATRRTTLAISTSSFRAIGRFWSDRRTHAAKAHTGIDVP